MGIRKWLVVALMSLLPTAVFGQFTHWVPQPERTRFVCKSGCDYATISAAVASIGDAAIDKRYTVKIDDGNWDEQVVFASTKSYISLEGTSRTGTRIRGTTNSGVTLQAGATGIGFSNLTIGGRSPVLAQTTVGTFFLDDVTLGIADGTEAGVGTTTSVDGIIETGNGTGNTWYLHDVDMESEWDFFVLGANTTVHYNGGNMVLRNTNNYQVNMFRCLSGGSGMWMFMDGVKWIGSGTTNLAVYGFLYDMPIAPSATRGTRIWFTNSLIDITLTGVTAADAACVLLDDAVTLASVDEIVLDGSVCRITDTAGTRPLEAINVTKIDADRSHWNVRWEGGGITLTPNAGGSATDINNLDNTAGFAITLSDLRMLGTATGAGVVNIFADQAMPPSNLTSGACLRGQYGLDIGGATVEQCFCYATNVWSCFNMATGAFVTGAGAPAD